MDTRIDQLLFDGRVPPTCSQRATFMVRSLYPERTNIYLMPFRRHGTIMKLVEYKIGCLLNQGMDEVCSPDMEVSKRIYECEEVAPWEFNHITPGEFDKNYEWGEPNIEGIRKPIYDGWSINEGIIRIGKGRMEPIHVVILQVFDVRDATDEVRRYLAFTEASRRTLLEFLDVARLLGQRRRYIDKDMHPIGIDILNNFCSEIEIAPGFGWNRICLSQEIERKVKEDFEFFLESKAWYIRNGLSYKRGYLLYGPPGNGKSMICRAMCTAPKFNVYTFDFHHSKNATSEELIDAFTSVRKNSPSIFLLEDFDRVLEPNSECPIGRETFLNCLDGAGTNEGVVIIATANHPEWLDNAFLRRPGRFDRVVCIGNPEFEQRLAFLRFLFSRSPDSTLNDKDIESLAERTEGLSMAAIKEVFVTAALTAFQRKDQYINAEDARSALQLVSDQVGNVFHRNAGFSTCKEGA